MTRDEALRLAKEIVLAEKWQWCEPVRVSKRRRFIFFGPVTWIVKTNAVAFGGDMRIRIDDRSGKVIAKGLYRS